MTRRRRNWRIPDVAIADLTELVAVLEELS